jgi:hypothetical protein
MIEADRAAVGITTHVSVNVHAVQHRCCRRRIGVPLGTHGISSARPRLRKALQSRPEVCCTCRPRAVEVDPQALHLTNNIHM